MKKGFTLIELLGVLTILIIISLIATPIVMGIITSSKESIDLSSVQNIVNSSEDLFYTSKIDEDKSVYTAIVNGENIYDFLEISGSIPEFADIRLDEDGKVTMAIYLNETCYTKDASSDDIIVTKDITSGECDSSFFVLTGEAIGDVILEQFKEDNSSLLSLSSNGGCTVSVEGKNHTYMDGCYLAGTQDSNYVWFDGFLYRIMGFDSYGNVKLITEETVTSIPYQSYGVEYSTSYAKTWLEDYFYSHLSSAAKDVMISSDYCDDSTSYSTSSNVISETCGGTTFSANVGIISLNEFNLSGGRDSYLESSQMFWTSTAWNVAQLFFVAGTSYVTADASYNSRGLRPIITVSYDTIITSGTGSYSDRYILNQTTDDVTAGELKEVATSGEYVYVNNKKYRVVSTSETGTKLISEEVRDTLTTYVDTLDVLSYSYYGSLLLGTSAALANDTTWYIGEYFLYGDDYSNYLDSTENSYTGKVGLIRVGEMLSGHSESMVNKDYWSATTESSTDAWLIRYYGDSYTTDNNYKQYSLRSVIEIATDVIIYSGNGTIDNPYEIKAAS
ncbi:MAG: hypothetical protein R3Y21_01890 [Mycoplasmatota bacterium]